MSETVWTTALVGLFRSKITAILDRLLQHCEIVAINGHNYRLENRLKAIEREMAVA
ncbi:ATP-binding protein [Streptomyces decoyicus]|uniref:ATP-binding protein n=1 Tax=Streptomyces decoyicus TaxID=249567 RepID=UPI00382A458A